MTRLLCMASDITLIPLLFQYECNRHLNETMVTVTTLQDAHVLKYFCRQFYFHPITSSQLFSQPLYWFEKPYFCTEPLSFTMQQVQVNDHVDTSLIPLSSTGIQFLD